MKPESCEIARKKRNANFARASRSTRGEKPGGVGGETPQGLNAAVSRPVAPGGRTDGSAGKAEGRK